MSSSFRVLLRYLFLPAALLFEKMTLFAPSVPPRLQLLPHLHHRQRHPHLKLSPRHHLEPALPAQPRTIGLPGSSSVSLPPSGSPFKKMPVFATNSIQFGPRGATPFFQVSTKLKAGRARSKELLPSLQIKRETYSGRSQVIDGRISSEIHSGSRSVLTSPKFAPTLSANRYYVRFGWCGELRQDKSPDPWFS